MNAKSMLFCIVVALASAPLCESQIQDLGSTVLTGTPAFQSYDGGPDTINVGNLNINWNIPIVNKPGRGTPFTYNLAYDSSVWTPISVSGASIWQPQGQFGWTTGGTGYYTFSASYASVGCGGISAVYAAYYSNFIYYDANNTPHSFNISTSNIIECANPSQSTFSTTPTITTATGRSLDGENYQIVAVGDNATITTPKGQVLTFPWLEQFSAPPTSTGQTIYANGNTITHTGASFIDTLNTTALTVTGGMDSPPLTMAYTGAGGAVEATLNYTSYTVQTNFQCSNVLDYGPTATNLPTSLSLPDGRSYRFTYEPTPGVPANTTGRIASVTLPSGGTISYTYSGGSNGINCSDGGAVTIVRATPDGTTTYARFNTTSTNSTTTITHPAYNGSTDQTVVNFLVVSPSSTSFSGGPITNYPTLFYEVERQDYSGSSATGTLLRTVLSCWNSVPNSPQYCSNTSGETVMANMNYILMDVYSRKVTVQWPNSSGISSGYVDSGFVNTASPNSTNSNSSWLPSSHVVYDYGAPGTGTFSTTPLQTVNSTFVGFGPFATMLPTEVKVLDGGNNSISDTQYTYDETTPTASGAPQLTAGYTAGNLTTTKQWVSGTNYLISHNTYYDDGNVSTSTDVNGNVTTYTYGACGDAFPTSVTTFGMSTAASWNCGGGVMTSFTDANGNTTTYNYGQDPYWRVTSVTDPLSNVTSYTYPTSSSNTSSATMIFNGGASVSGSLTTYDSLGRAIIQQAPTSPSLSTYNSVQTSYDSNGRSWCQSIPYIASASGKGTGPFSCTTYDPLNRTTLFTDTGGGTVAYSYNENDTLVNQGPAPSGENTKRRQLEYNGAGWLTSVCEVTSLSGSGSCGQHTAQTGYLTRYTYNGAGNLLTANQNAQSGSTQTRSLTYDGLGRKISELIPEWTNSTTSGGTGAYTYDSDASGACSGSYPGDLVKSVDNAGNVTCFTYDGLHRVLTSNVVSGPYASVTPQNNYVYDAATSVSAVQNAKGSLAEAYTNFVGSTTKLTDVFFSNYPTSLPNGGKGMVSQMWESTPHSSGYLFTQETTYPNGALQAVSAYRLGSGGTDATGSVSIGGGEQSLYEGNPCSACLRYGCPPCPIYVYDSGTVGITVGGQSVSTGYGQGSSGSSLASSLASSINASSSFPVTATVSGSVLTLTSKVPGTGSNYTISGYSSTNMTSYFSSASFSVSSGAMTGGTNSTPNGIGPAVTYAIDSAGRPFSAADGTYGISPVTATAYNVAGSPTTITFGNAGTGSGSDQDTFGYDPNTFRPTSFSYAIRPAASAFTVSGNLIWNANGSLNQLAYTDGNDSSKNQTCTYSADDLSRIASVNCGSSSWGQNFTYDAFGNIKKTVPGSNTGTAYNAAYNPITNQVSGNISPLPNYDANGNQLTSTGASLTWNALAQPISVNGTAANYDALGRMVETGASSVPSATFDSGTLSAAISFGVINCTVSVGYSTGSTPATLATELASAVNSSSCLKGYASATTNVGIVTLSGLLSSGFTYTLQISSSHNTQFSAASFALSVYPTSFAGGSSATMAFSGSEQSIVTVPACTGCKQFFFRPAGAQLGIYSGSLVKETIPLPGGATAVYNANGLNYIRHTDWLGSSRLGTTWAHAVYSKEAYAPFGETYNEAGTPDRSFTGQDQDVASGAGGTGTYDFLFRKYDPSAGRWLSPDPAGWDAVDQTAPQSLNRYAYVQNQPLNAVDPYGLILCVSSDGTNFDSGTDDCPDGSDSYVDTQSVTVTGGDSPPIPLTPTGCDPNTDYACSIQYQQLTQLSINGNPFTATDDNLGKRPCLNVNNFANAMIQNAGGKTTSGGNCAGAVKAGLTAGGLNGASLHNGPQNYGPGLQNLGFVPINTTSYQTGDVMILQPWAGKAGGNGHIQMWDGSQWVSDFLQPNMSDGYPGPGSTYEQNSPSYQLYRDPDPCK